MMAFNPNGNTWVNSDSMGKQLLIKAGWSKGEGIGKNKQGTNVHIKVSIKNEKDGIGFKSQKRQSDLSLMQCFTFDNILKSKYGKPEINSEEVDELSQRGLSRARYGRAVPKEFFKPVESDELNKILCKSKLEKHIEEIPIINSIDSEIDKNANFTSPYTVFEYFTMKMKNSNIKIKNLSGYICEKIEVLRNSKEKQDSKKRKSENEDSFEVEKKKSKSTESICENTDSAEILSIKSVKKKKKLENIQNELNSSEISIKKMKNSELISPLEETSLKKKKRKIELDDDKKKSEGEILTERKKKKSKKINNVINLEIESKNEDLEIESKNEDLEIGSKNEELFSISKKNNKKSVQSIEIIDKETVCPWDSCNIDAIEGYKYY